MHRASSAVIAVLGIALTQLIPSSSAQESTCPRPAPRAEEAQWPPSAEGDSFDVVHFGEGHWNEGQGPNTMPILVQDVRAFDPSWVAFSSDQADTGTPDRLGCFRLLMEPIRGSGIPWYASPGNHDRTPVAGPGGFTGELEIWRTVYAAMPAPWGDNATPKGFVAPADEPDDGEGASSHYYVDYGPRGEPVMRLIVLDNSLQSLTTSDTDQFPAVGAGEKDLSQLLFLRRVAQDAQDKGLLSFVLMHQPTRDPRDLRNVNPISLNHTMGKGLSADNTLFEQIAEQTGVDLVGLGHIQGNVVYEVGSTRYFIDGGGGGSPYTNGEVGTDTGYYYGFRIVRFFEDSDGWDFRSYFVPIVDRLEIDAPSSVRTGESVDLVGRAFQPFDQELPGRAGLPNEQIVLDLRLPDDARIDRATLPELSFVWETSDPDILRPLVTKGAPGLDDPAFDRTRMSLTGKFEAVGKGVATIFLKVGTHISKVKIRVLAR